MAVRALQVFQQLLQRYLQPEFARAAQNRNLQQADCAQRDRFRPANRGFKHMDLLARQLLSIR